MADHIKWIFMVDWLSGDGEARAKGTAEIVADCLVGKIVGSTQHKKLTKPVNN